MNKLFTSFLILFCCIISFGQSKLADIMYSNFEYELAADLYSKEDSLTKKQLKQFAYCYYINNQFEKAIPLFELALKKDTNNLQLAFHYADALKSTGRYTSAQNALSPILIRDSTNPNLQLLIQSIDSLKKWDTIKFFKKLAEFKPLNTPAAEFSPSFYDDGIYYIIEKGDEDIYNARNINLIENNDSLSPKEKKAFLQTLEKSLAYGTVISPRTYLYKMPLDVSKLFHDYRNIIPKESYDTARLYVTHKGFNITSYDQSFNKEQVFYTRHPVTNNWNPNTPMNPLLFKGKHHKKKPKLIKRRKIPILFLPSTFGSGEVSVTDDGKTIYFVSDKRKGYGGTDIYMSHQKKSGRWGRAINLGPLVNTPFDEESPRIYDDSVLFFSSNGWPGYGKADIFKCKIVGDSIHNVTHLPYPVNSSGDDIHFVLHPFDESVAILNSDRSKGTGDEDIYFAHMIPIEPYVKGYIKSLKDSSILKNSFVRLLNENNYELNQTTTTINGKYRFSLERGKSYEICATKMGMSGCIQVDADYQLFRNEKKDIYLDTATTIQGYVVDENNDKVGGTKIEFSNNKDELLTTVFSRDDGFFQIDTKDVKDFFILAQKDKKVGSLKLKISPNYKTDSIVKIKIINNTAIINGIVYDTNRLPSENAVVRLLDSNNIEVERITTKKDGYYELSMTALNNYRLIATNYGMAKDTLLIVDEHWGSVKKKDLYLKNHITVQGHTYFKDTSRIVDEVAVAVESGFDSKYLTVYSDKNGFFQFPLYNDSLLYMDGTKKKLRGTTTVNIDSNFNTVELHDIILHRIYTDAHGVVIYSNDSVAENITVELIDRNGKIESETITDSLGRFYFELRTDTDYELYASEGDLEAVENIHTGVFWKKNNDIVLKLNIKGTPTFGLVVDAENREPLSFVKITLTDSTTNLKNITYSNDQGLFEMSIKKNSTNYIKLEKDNYFPKTIMIKIGDVVPKIIDLSRDYDLSLTKSDFMIEPIYFEFDSHEITPHSKEQLNKLARWLRINKTRTCNVYGFTDCRGTQDYNLRLSKNRAQTVRVYLSYKGISMKRTFNIPMGSTNYVNNCYQDEDCTEAEHRENRRCEFQINDIKE